MCLVSICGNCVIRPPCFRLAFRPAWEQASHNGELAHAVEAGALVRGNVTDLGAVLAGTAEGRRSAEETTVFDSTGLAIQDLAIALAAYAKVEELDLQTIDV
jgi:ornithine cyclodeaminase/alanine dehydrogenase-like protein (mu-crystallin family)